jgi:hypothetical protein
MKNNSETDEWRVFSWFVIVEAGVRDLIALHWHLLLIRPWRLSDAKLCHDQWYRWLWRHRCVTVAQSVRYVFRISVHQLNDILRQTNLLIFAFEKKAVAFLV